MRKLIKIFTALIVMMLIAMSGTRAFADDPDDFVRYDDGQKSDGSDLIADDSLELMDSSSDGVVTICIDPGHGGEEPGSVLYNGGYEKNTNLKIALFLKEALEEYSSVRVIMTRTEDVNLGLAERARVAASGNADLFISIHSDYYWGGQASGMSIFYPNEHYRQDLSQAAYAAAVNVRNELSALGLKVFQGIRTRSIEIDDDDLLDKDELLKYTYPATDADAALGIKIYESDVIPGYRFTLGDYYGVIRNSKLLGVPAIIVEHGFGNNAGDFNSFLSDDAKLKSLAEADARALATTFGLEKFELARLDDGNWYSVRNGEILEKTFIAQGTVNETYGKWYVLDGRVQLEYTGLATVDDSLWAITEGMVDTGFEGFVLDEDGTLWYLKKGQQDYSFSGLHEYEDDTWWFENGRVNPDYCSVELWNGGWWYVDEGKVCPGHNGTGTNSYGTWLITDGKVTFSENGVVNGRDGNWYYASGGKVQTGYTGIRNNSNGWWRIVNGVVDFGAEGVYQNEYGWWYVSDGKVRFDYNGTGTNSHGTWLITNGKVTFSENGVVYGKDGNWYYAQDGKVQTGYSGLQPNSNGWWRIENGMVDFGAEGVYQNEYGWWYVSDGKVQFAYNGTGTNSHGTWLITNGKVTFSENGVVNGRDGNWYYASGGKVQTGYTGIRNNSNGWWRIVNGKVDFSCNTIEQNEYGWWYLQGGKVIFSYNGIGHNSNGSWYVKNGKVDFTFSGTYGEYTILDGKVIS